jgi:hypothetical protein
MQNYRVESSDDGVGGGEVVANDQMRRVYR